MMTMPSSILDFRTLLGILAVEFDKNEFDSKTAAEAVAPYLYSLYSVRKEQKILRRAMPKLISNDLRRLYQMGFLRRRKVPRRCKNKKGREYNCGYKYMYKITAQGWKYLDYLLKSSSAKKRLYITAKDIEGIIEAIRRARIGVEKALLIKLIEEDEIERSLGLFLAINEETTRLFSSRGSRRFQTQELLFKQGTSQVACYLTIIHELENQIRERDLRIDLLIEELKKCREQRYKLGTLNLPYYLEHFNGAL